MSSTRILMEHVPSQTCVVQKGLGQSMEPEAEGTRCEAEGHEEAAAGVLHQT